MINILPACTCMAQIFLTSSRIHILILALGLSFWTLLSITIRPVFHLIQHYTSTAQSSPALYKLHRLKLFYHVVCFSSFLSFQVFSQGGRIFSDIHSKARRTHYLYIRLLYESILVHNSWMAAGTMTKQRTTKEHATNLHCQNSTRQNKTALTQHWTKQLVSKQHCVTTALRQLR